MQIQAPFDPFRGSPSRAVASRQPSTEPQVTDAPLIAICEKWRIANTEHDEACTRRAIADTALCAARALGSADLDRIEIAAEQAEAASTAACLREWDLIEEVVATRAQTKEGLFAALRMMGEQVRLSHVDGVEPEDIYERALLRLSADAARLGDAA